LVRTHDQVGCTILPYSRAKVSVEERTIADRSRTNAAGADRVAEIEKAVEAEPVVADWLKP
jgi:hypothetical protein